MDTAPPPAPPSRSSGAGLLLVGGLLVLGGIWVGRSFDRGPSESEEEGSAEGSGRPSAATSRSVAGADGRRSAIAVGHGPSAPLPASAALHLDDGGVGHLLDDGGFAEGSSEQIAEGSELAADGASTLGAPGSEPEASIVVTLPGAAGARAGAVDGVVLWKGIVPGPIPIDRDIHFCGTSVPDDSVVVADGGLANV